MIQWLEVGCYNCGESNLVCNGDVNDMSSADTTGFRCFECSADNTYDSNGDCIRSEEEQFDKGVPLPDESDIKIAQQLDRDI